MEDTEGRDFVQVIAASPEGGGVLQRAGPEPASFNLALPDKWKLRTEWLESRTTIHLPNPPQAWLFASGGELSGTRRHFQQEVGVANLP